MKGGVEFSQSRAFRPGEYNLEVGAKGLKSFLGLCIPRSSELQESAAIAGIARGENVLVLVQVR